MSVDARGKLRGVCQKDGCDCDAFVREGDTIRCAYCDHPPGVHELITGASAQVGTAEFKKEIESGAIKKIEAAFRDLQIGEYS